LEKRFYMPASHRKFGDLLEEGIKRVHITKKKPIGFILDEFGYELRPDDSSKGRHALGHWYYKKRIPAELSDVAKLAQLIVTNSDVDRAWLKSFLESAGYADTDAFCNQYFLPVDSESIQTKSTTEQPTSIQDSGEQTSMVVSSANKRSYSVLYFVIVVVVVLGTIAFYTANRKQSAIANIAPAPTAIEDLSTISYPTTDLSTVIANPAVTASAATPIATATLDFAQFDGKCPTVSAVPAIQYSSPQSFMEYLNSGGSTTSLQSGFNSLLQQKAIIKGGQIESIDLTGDGTPEVIIAAILGNDSLWQILGCNQGQYQEIVSNNEPDERYLRFAVDLNGDKLPEIISYRKTQPETTPLYDFMVEEWNGHQIASLLDETRFNDIGERLPADIVDWQRTIANGTITTRDVNGDGIFEIIIEGGLITPVPTCETRFERQFTETWAWNGKSFQFSDRVYALPIYRFQRSVDGDLAFALKQYDRALTAYQDVLFDANLFTHDQYLPQLEFCKGIESGPNNIFIENEQSQLEAYARWRILLINTINSSEDAMQVVYQTLQNKFPEGKPGHDYAVIAKAFWEQYQQNQKIADACDKANTAAKSLSLYPTHTADNICYIP